jgi:hypothetical protein
MKLLIMQLSPAYLFIPLWSRYSPQQPVLTHSVCYFNVRDQVSYPYKAAGKFIHLYILIFMFLRQHTRRLKVLG